MVAFAARAAPAPTCKPQQPRVWLTGWNEPADPTGVCRFDREGDRLTISLGTLEGWSWEKDGPRQMRDVEGDFVLEIRLKGKYFDGN